ncbi:endo-1,4-beta-xylanase [Paenibacillus sp. MCAF9]|uniref:endo-1,4-beta-xylanase n=1 Tax=Paenibacillus sp. MCAF9 TaxID=3233046 RepID=UPI003F9AC077
MSRRFKQLLLSLLAAALLVPQIWYAPNVNAASATVPVILYHVITDNPSGDYQYSTANFKKQMKYLNDNGYTTVSAEQYVDIIVNGATAPSKPILLTFDDATPDFITNALPVLTQYNMKAVSFVIQDNIGSWGMTLSQLNTLKNNPNISLQNHTKTHDQAVWTTSITKATAAAEIQSANTFLKGITGKDPILLAYPYGNYNADVKAAATENGIKVGFKAWSGDDDALAMGRILIKKDDTLNTFAAAIGGPTSPTPEAIGNVVVSNDFENGTQGWFKRGTETVTASTNTAHSGTGSLLVQGRTDNWNGPGFNLAATGKLNKESVYELSAWVKLKEGTTGSETIQFGAQQTGAANEYLNPGSAATVTADAWVQVKGEYTYDMNANALQVYLQSSSSKTASFYVDDFQVKVVKPAVLVEKFENGINGWTGNGATATVTNAVSHSGSNALLVTGRAQNYHGPSLVLTNMLEKGAEYEISAYAKLDTGAASTQLKASIEQSGLTGNDQFKEVIGLTTVTDGAWVKLSGTYTYNTAATGIKLYFESEDAGKNTSFAIDDIVITQKSAAPPPGFLVLSQSFEDGQLGGWTDLGWNGTGTAVVSSDYASEGTKSLLYKDRSDRKSAVSLNLTSKLVSGHKYDISFKLRSAQGTDNYHLGAKVKSDGTDNYPWIIGNQAVTDSAWKTFELKGYEVPASTTEFLVWIEANVYSPDETATAKADFYMDEFVIKDVTPGAEPPRTPAVPFTTITFEDQSQGGFDGRAKTETLTVTNEANHTDNGSYALKVADRTDSWHGPTIRVEQNVDKGSEYKVTAWVKLISPTSSQLQLSTQVGNGSTASYNTIQAKTVNAADGWVKLEGTYRYSSVGDEFLTIYVESSSNKTASFYIDDISFVNTGSIPISVQKDLTPIKTKYQDNFLIGNAVSAADFDGTRLELLKLHHNVVTAENAMKPDATQAVKGTFTYADSLIDKAIAAGMKVHGHVLVWHQQTPAWMTTSNGSPLSRDEALANMRTHIQTVMTHYAEKYGNNLISWDVVNEAMNDNPSNPTDWVAALRTSPWKTAIGNDYVEQAFLAAREVLDANPSWDIKLYYNDYNDDNQNKATAIYNMVKELNDKYALTHPGKKLIDGVGMQAHYNVNTKPDNVKASLERFISLGVEVSITELDITAGNGGTITEKEAIAQGYLYAQLFQIYKEHAANIARVTFWGLNDSTSWRKEQPPLLFDNNLQAKQAYYGVIDPSKFIAEHPPSSATASQTSAKYGTPVIDGTIDAIWSDAPEVSIQKFQMAWQGARGVARALWDDHNLYMLIQVTGNAELDSTSPNEHEQDSVEVFVDENNGKTASYQSDDGQYRVNYNNQASFNPSSKAAGFESATSLSGTNYTVEMKIPLTSITPENNMKLGFDVQINDGKNGARQSVAVWNDLTGQGYQDTSVFGVLTLSGKNPPATPPVAPANVTASAVNASSIKLNWNTTSDTSVTFSVYRGTSESGSFTVIASGVPVSEFTDTGLDASTKYYYYVKAVKGELVSDASTVANATTIPLVVTPPEEVLEAPTGLKADAQSQSSIKLNWNTTSDTSVIFSVYRGTSESGSFTVIASGVPVSEFTDTNLTSSTKYYYYVKAVKGELVSDASTVVTATTSDASPQPGTDTPSPVTEQPAENGQITPKVTVNNGKASSNISAANLQKAFDQAVTNAAGKKKVTINIPATAGANSYDVQLPLQSLKDSGSTVLVIKTVNGTVELPGNMLAGTRVGSSEFVSVRLGKVSTEALSNDLRQQIGNHPVISLEVLAGDSVVAWNNPNAPVTVSVPYTPTAEELSNPDHIIIWYIDGSGKATPVPNARYDAASGTVKFSTTHFSIYAVVFVVKSFGDLQSVPWAKKAIEAMASRGIINGTSENAYDPKASIKRADFLSLLVRALELKGNNASVTMFSDVDSSAYYYEAVKIAAQLGIIQGTGSNLFDPNSKISRQDMMVIAARAAKAAGKALPTGGTLDAFSDEASVASYAKDSVAALVNAGIVQGSSGKLAPNSSLTRAEAAVILQRIWSK